MPKVGFFLRVCDILELLIKRRSGKVRIDLRIVVSLEHTAFSPGLFINFVTEYLAHLCLLHARVRIEQLSCRTENVSLHGTGSIGRDAVGHVSVLRAFNSRLCLEQFLFQLLHGRLRSFFVGFCFHVFRFQLSDLCLQRLLVEPLSLCASVHSFYHFVIFVLHLKLVVHRLFHLCQTERLVLFLFVLVKLMCLHLLRHHL